MSNNKYKILLVEDDWNISNMIQTLLENLRQVPFFEAAANCCGLEMLYERENPMPGYTLFMPSFLKTSSL